MNIQPVAAGGEDDALPAKRHHPLAPADGYLPDYDFKPDALDLATLWRILWERRYLVLAVAGAGLAVALIYSLLQTPLHKSRATLELNPPTIPILSGSDANSQNPEVPQTDMGFLATQYGLLKSKALAAHVTLWGMRPTPFACAVAMSARFGFDINRDLLTDDDWAVCRRASAAYRRLRDVIQHGDLYRLVSPDEGPRAALAYLHPDRDHGVVCAYPLPSDDDSAAEPSHAERLALAGLDDDTTYRVTPIDLTCDEAEDAFEATGRALAIDGLDWPDDGPCTARIWELDVVSGTP